MSRHWLLTSTTYGSWLPGDRRGFVSNVVAAGKSVRHNSPGSAYDANLPRLEAAARHTLKSAPIRLNLMQAEVILEQFQETARSRGWDLLSVAVLANHFHVVVGLDDTIPPHFVLKDFKSYASRALNTRWGKPQSGTWWTSSGSKRFLPNEESLAAAVRYVESQAFPLALWSDPARKWSR